MGAKLKARVENLSSKGQLAPDVCFCYQTLASAESVKNTTKLVTCLSSLLSPNPGDSTDSSALLWGNRGQLLLSAASDLSHLLPSATVQSPRIPSRWQGVTGKGPGAPNHKAEPQSEHTGRGVEGELRGPKG